MDYTKIVEKALLKQDYTADVKEFTPEQKTELSQKISEAAKAEADKELAKIDGLRQEKKRLETQPPKEDTSVMDKFQKEQEDEARKEFFADSDFTVPPELTATFDETYKALKKGEVSKNQITQVLRRAYAATMPDDLIATKKKATQAKKAADDFNAGGADAHVSISPADEQKYSKAAKTLFTQWQAQGYTGKNYTLDKAETVSQGGMERIL